MSMLCALRWTVIALVWLASLFGCSVLAYGYGRVHENKRYWRMLERAGSRITRRDQ